MNSFRALALASIALLAFAAGAFAQFTTTNVATGLNRPLYIVSPPNDPRLFIIEQRIGSGTTGRIRIVSNGSLLATPFLSISAVATGDEQGLLGLAFHPAYANNGRFYIYYINSSGSSVIEEYTVTANPDIANTSRRRLILTFTQPASNHNGGWIAFGPDGFLYIASGDGGAANDTAGAGNNAQNLNTLLGKMLRINVDGDADDFPADANRNFTIPPSNPFVGIANTRPEIWSYGLRNPWRPSFDRLTGDLWIADVGQDANEEINFQPAGIGGQNWGWRCREGTRFTGLGGCVESTFTSTPPVFEYLHGSNIQPLLATGCSVTGGYVYRGCRIPALTGRYLVADYCSGWIYAVDPTPPITNASSVTLIANLGFGVTSFGEDANGELYVAIRGGTNTGRVVRIDPTTAPAVCCPEDYNRDASRNLDDLSDFITDFYTLPPIPGSLQPNAFTFSDRIVGYARPCPAAASATAPYLADDYRRFGFRIGFSPDGSNACPTDISQQFPNLDILSDYITAFYAATCG
jgi:hypothetical protein